MADNAQRPDDILNQDAATAEQLQNAMNRLNATIGKLVGTLEGMSQSNARDAINDERNRFQRAYRERSQELRKKKRIK